MCDSVRVVSRRGLRRGCTSGRFTLSELVEAEEARNHENIYVEMDGCGELSARGGAARAVRRARLAPAPPHATALLCLSSAPAPASAPDLRLVLRLAADVPPLQELLLWFDEQTLAHLDMPFLTLRNITGKKTYSCHLCDAEFEHPNPLKVHMFLSCQPYESDSFWRRCISRLRAAVASPAPLYATTVPAPASSLRTGLSAGLSGGIGADPAQLEALAAAWGRSRDGHVCLYCGKLYSRKYGLKIHIRTHTGYKPLRCRHCLRAFGDPSNLNKHVRLHAAGAGASAEARAGAHACSVCHKPLARRRDLQRHMRAHHPHLAA